MKNSSIKNRSSLIAFCFVIILFYFFMASSVDGFGPIDDHQFIRTIYQGQGFGAYVMPELGRFIPLTAQEYVLTARFIDVSPHLFHVISGIKALLCGILLLYCLILTRASNWLIAILWCIVIFSVGFANATFRLQVGELNAFLLVLIFIWSILVIQKKDQQITIVKDNNISGLLGLFALILAFFYKELIFVFALAFSFSEILRYYRRHQEAIPKRIYSLLVIGTAYILLYLLWSSNYKIVSYASFHTIDTLHLIRLYTFNDPVLVFILLPLVVYRVIAILRDCSMHTVYDSFLIASSIYVGSYLFLGIYNTYYLLPAYGFAVCGISGILANNSSTRLYKFAIVILALLGINNFPVAISDMQALKSISNNHYKFIKALSEWIWANPLPSSERRILVLTGVSTGGGIEVISSLKIFLQSLGLQDSLFEVKATEPSDNENISSFYGVKDKTRYNATIGNLLIFNPYQQKKIISPPILSPSFSEVYRSSSEWELPRWSSLDWVKLFINRDKNYEFIISENMRYTGYAAMLMTRQAASIQIAPVKSPSYRLGPLFLPARMPVGQTKKLDILIENTGTEIWPSSITNSSKMNVGLSYVWTDINGKVILEGDKVPFPEFMRPKDKAKVSIFMQVPLKPGRYKLVVSPVQDVDRWFYVYSRDKIDKQVDVF